MIKQHHEPDVYKRTSAVEQKSRRIVFKVFCFKLCFKNVSVESVKKEHIYYNN